MLLLQAGESGQEEWMSAEVEGAPPLSHVLCSSFRLTCTTRKRQGLLSPPVPPAPPARKYQVSGLGSPITVGTFVEGPSLNPAHLSQPRLKPLVKTSTCSNCFGMSIALHVSTALLAPTCCLACATVSYFYVDDSSPCLDKAS